MIVEVYPLPSYFFNPTNSQIHHQPVTSPLLSSDLQPCPFSSRACLDSHPPQTAPATPRNTKRDEIIISYLRISSKWAFTKRIEQQAHSAGNSTIPKPYLMFARIEAAHPPLLLLLPPGSPAPLHRLSFASSGDQVNAQSRHAGRGSLFFHFLERLSVH